MKKINLYPDILINLYPDQTNGKESITSFHQTDIAFGLKMPLSLPHSQIAASVPFCYWTVTIYVNGPSSRIQFLFDLDLSFILFLSWCNSWHGRIFVKKSSYVRNLCHWAKIGLSSINLDWFIWLLPMDSFFPYTFFLFHLKIPNTPSKRKLQWTDLFFVPIFLSDPLS